MLGMNALRDALMAADKALDFAACGPLLMVLGLWLTPGAEALADAQVELGRRIYESGILPSGAKLQGLRFDESLVEGQDAACINCHRRSGMGSKEGKDPAPPVTGKFLFGEARQSVVLTDPRSPKNVIQSHQPYTEATLAEAINRGVDRQGKTMNVLMPRYKLDRSGIKALTAYLRQLSIQYSPGVSDTAVRFATIIAPGVESKLRDSTLAMMKGAFLQRNSSHTLKGGRTRAQVQEDRHTLRKWELVVWELQGAPETWGKQLADRYARDPVFAVISGIAHGTWAPVHAFCEQAQVPCLFPSVPLPGGMDGFYSLYFSRGVELEADVIAHRLADPEAPRLRRVVQLRSDDAVARAAAERLRVSLTGQNLSVEERVLPEGQTPGGKSPLEGLTEDDGLVLWLRPEEMAQLAQVSPQLPTSGYFSATLAGGDVSAVPAEWRAGAYLAFPYAIGQQRQQNLQRFRQWIKIFRYPLVNETLQSEMFFNVVFLSDLTMHLLDNYYRDYLIERVEDMLGESSNVSPYPHLSLGQHQRFASKGAYLLKVGANGTLPDQSEWLVP